MIENVQRDNTRCDRADRIAYDLVGDLVRLIAVGGPRAFDQERELEWRHKRGRRRGLNMELLDKCQSGTDNSAGYTFRESLERVYNACGVRIEKRGIIVGVQKRVTESGV